MATYLPFPSPIALSLLALFVLICSFVCFSVHPARATRAPSHAVAQAPDALPTHRRHLSQTITSNAPPPGNYLVIHTEQELRDQALDPTPTKLLRTAASVAAFPFGSSPLAIAPNTVLVIDAANRTLDATQMQKPVVEGGINNTIEFYNSCLYMPDMLWPWAFTTIINNSHLVFNNESSDPELIAWQEAMQQGGPGATHYNSFTRPNTPEFPQVLILINTSITSAAREERQAHIAALAARSAALSPEAASAGKDTNLICGFLGLPTWSIAASCVGIVLIAAIVTATIVKHSRRKRQVMIVGPQPEEATTCSRQRRRSLNALSEPQLSDSVPAAESGRFHSFRTDSTSALVSASSTAQGGCP